MVKFSDLYRTHWPQVGALAGMALAGGTVFAKRKQMTDLRAIAVMNSATMAAHQVEEYVEPGYFPGQVNRGLFKSDHPRNWPANPEGIKRANLVFTAIYIPPILFPKVKWFGIPTALLGFGQAFAHIVVMPARLRFPYSPGGANALLLQTPLSIAYFHALKKEGSIKRSDWIKSAGVLAAFFGAVAATNLSAADKESPYSFTPKQMGRWDMERPAPAEADDAPAEPVPAAAP